jgi:hypothetical protein
MTSAGQRWHSTRSTCCLMSGRAVPVPPKKSERALIRRERRSSPEDWFGEKTVARRYEAAHVAKQAFAGKPRRRSRPPFALRVGTGKAIDLWVSGLIGVLRRSGRDTVMRNSVDMDSAHSRAIIRAIGERLREWFKEDRELPASLKTQVERLRQVEDEQSKS